MTSERCIVSFCLVDYISAFMSSFPMICDPSGGCLESDRPIFLVWDISTVTGIEAVTTPFQADSIWQGFSYWEDKDVYVSSATSQMKVLVAKLV